MDVAEPNCLITALRQFKVVWGKEGGTSKHQNEEKTISLLPGIQGVPGGENCVNFTDLTATVIFLFFY